MPYVEVEPLLRPGFPQVFVIAVGPGSEAESRLQFTLNRVAQINPQTVPVVWASVLRHTLSINCASAIAEVPWTIKSSSQDIDVILGSVDQAFGKGWRDE